MDRFDREELRWGFNLSMPILSSPPLDSSAPKAEGQTQDAGARMLAAAGGARRRRGGDNLVQLSIFHTWLFEEEIVIRPGLPVLDRLSGFGGGNSGGTPAHRFRAEGGIQRNGLRFRMTMDWQSGTEVVTGAVGSGERLDFGSLTEINLLAQADLGQRPALVRSYPWMRGTRLSLRVQDLLDARQLVLDENGATPAAYHPNLLDRTGRTVRVGIRKQFSKRVRSLEGGGRDL